MIRSSRVLVGTTAIRILCGDCRCTIRNRGDAPIYVGGADVTVDDGFQVDPGESVGMMVGLVAAVYAIAASGEQPTHVLIVSL